MKRIAVLGSTGSIGKNCLTVAKHLKENIQVVALASHSNIDLLEIQAREFFPELIGVYDKDKAYELKKRLPNIRVVAGIEGLNEVASFPKVDMVVSAISGTKGLEPTIAAIKAKKDVALANKEVLVSGGGYVISLAKAVGVSILPVDSEHSAIFQCLQGQDSSEIKRLILTASGGPFRQFSHEQLKHVTVEDALKHPNWSMGPKVTIDSSTLMNKGLEIIEAYWLFNVLPHQIEVVIHPQSIIHSMVEFLDASIIAQMGEPHMITPIQYALTFPKRQSSPLQSFDFTKSSKLEFFPPDILRFPCLRLAYTALEKGGSLACFMNAANEVLVNRFIRKEISWTDIAKKLEDLMQLHSIVNIVSLEHILEIDAEAREAAADA